MNKLTMTQTREALSYLSIVDMINVNGLANGTIKENLGRIQYTNHGGRAVKCIYISSRARKANLDAIAAAVAAAIGEDRWTEIVSVVTGTEEPTQEPQEAPQDAPSTEAEEPAQEPAQEPQEAPQHTEDTMRGGYTTMTERYDYLEHVTADVIAAICDSYTPAEIRERIDEDREKFAEDLNDDLWTDDSVTGNASGSYYCNAWKAEEALAHNWTIIYDMVKEFDAADILRRGPEVIDVSIRCYLLSQAIDAALDQLDEITPAVYCTVYTDIGIISREDEHITMDDARDRAYMYARQGYTAEIRDDSTDDTLDTYPAHTDPNTYYIHSRS